MVETGPTRRMMRVASTMLVVAGFALSARGQNAQAPTAPPPQASEATTTTATPPAPASASEAPKYKAIALPADSTGLLGHLIESQSDKDIGRIIDVLVDPRGEPQALVIDVGGFMGVGTRRVAIAWSALRFSQRKDALAIGLDVPTAAIQAAPEYVAGKDVQALTAAPAQ